MLTEETRGDVGSKTSSDDVTNDTARVSNVFPRQSHRSRAPRVPKCAVAGVGVRSSFRLVRRLLRGKDDTCSGIVTPSARVFWAVSENPPRHTSSRVVFEYGRGHRDS